MPYRKENYILLEQSVTVDSKEVDALVTKIGEVLQLHNNGANQKTMACLHGANQKTMACLHGLNNSNGSGNVKQANSHCAGLQRRAGCCIRLRNRGPRSRAVPYSLPDSSDPEWDHFKAWNRKRMDVSGEHDDPHRLLQELILSGNLIKEAVRRLQFPGSECVDPDGRECQQR